MKYELGEWNEYKKYEFDFEGCPAIVVEPKKAAKGNPWVWRAEFFGAFPYVDKKLLEKGWFIAYCKLSDRFGSCAAVDDMKRFKDFITKEFKLSKKADIFGFSRGGLYAFNYSVKYPDDISVMYLDAPVIDLRSWPLGSGKGEGSVRDVELCKKEFKVNDINEIKDTPIFKLDLINKTDIPLIMVYGDSDEVVPYDENGEKLAAVFDGVCKYICKNGCKHHPHSLEDPSEIVEFIEEHRTY